jgi:hemoglobin
MMSPDRRTQTVERTGIDEDMIERLVRAFYDKVRKDVLLVPIFDEKIISLESHLERMCAVWSSVELMTGRYRGQSTEKHLSLQ